MRVKSVALYKFRNLDQQTIQLGSGVNLIMGRNGEGKSNFLEALYIVSHAASFRTSHFSELIQWGQEEASVFANVETAGTDGEIEETKLGLVLHPKTREAYIHGQRVNSLAGYLGRFKSVCFSPHDLALVKGAPGVRRKFLDRQIIDLEPQLTKHLLAYHKAVKSKAKILKADSVTEKELEPWNKLIATEAHEIMLARCRCIKLLERQAARFLKQLAPQDGILELSLESDLLDQEANPHSAEKILEIIQTKQNRELKQKTVLVGPHRDDIRIILDSTDARPFASQGQARSISLCLRLATIAILEEDSKESPVVLLDDVESELDEERCAALYELALEPGRQVIITGTASHAAIRNRISDFVQFRVTGGKIEQA